MKTKHTTIRASVFAMAFALCVPSAWATSYYWIGGNSAEWTNGSNWSLTEDGAAANAYPNGSDDYAHFPSGADLTLNGFVTVRGIFTDGTLTLSGNGSGGVRTASSNNSAPLYMGGEGLVRLAGITINVPYATSSAAAQTQITNNLEIVAGTTNTFTLCTGSSRYASLHMRGALSGSGTMIVRCNSDSGNYQAYFYGDASAFTGTFADHGADDDNAARININSAAALSGTATYNLAATNSAAGQNYVLRAGGTGTTYQIGALNGEVHFDGNNNSKNTQYYGYTLEIGGKNEDCSFGGTLARSAYASYTKKVGTADMTFTGAQIPNITIENGTYIIGASTALPNTMVFKGGAFSVAQGVLVNPVASFSPESTAAVVFDDRGGHNTWSAALTDSIVPCGFTKKGAGTLTLTATPTHTTTTTIEDGVLVVPQGTTIAELACAGGKLTVPFVGTENETEVLTISALAAGTTLADLQAAVAVAGATTSVEPGAGGYTVKATRTPLTFTWTGAVDTDWTTPGNWTVGGVSATTAPMAIDNVLFPASNAAGFESWSVSLPADVVAATITNEADVVYSGAHLITAAVIGGSGKTVLGDGTGFLEKSGGMTVDTPVQVTASSESPASVRTAREERIRINGDLTGNGTLKIGKGDTSLDERVVCELNGDNRAFAGTILVPNDKNTRNNTKLMSANASSSNTSWTVYNSSKEQFLPFSGQTVCFGALNGAIYQASTYYNNVFEIGALNEDCSFGGKLGATSQNHITKVGTATLTFSGSDMGNLVVKGGVFASLNEASLPRTSITFAGDGGFFDPVTNTVDFAAKLVNSTEAPIGILVTNDVSIGEIPSSNTAGLTKKGAGTLTLTAAPLYTGLTTIEEGTLVVPDGTALTVNAFSAGTLSGATPATYAYPANTVLSAPATSGSVSYAAPLDISNIASVDASAATLVVGQPYVVAAATAVTGYTKESLAALPFTLPAGTKAEKWALKVLTVEGRRCLCIAPKLSGTRIVIR